MMKWIVPPCASLIEPSIAPEFYVEHIGGIEWLSGNIRLHLVCDQMPLGAGEPVAPQKVVVVKLIGPLCNIPGAIGQLAQCLWSPPNTEAPPTAPKRRVPHIVR